MSKQPRNTARRDRDRARIKATGAACHICGEAIDYDLPWMDPMSFVVDHVIPLAKGGSDALANKRAAHRLDPATPSRELASWHRSCGAQAR